MTTGIHGQRIMTALGAPPLSFGFVHSTGERGRDQLVGTSKAEYARTTTITLRGDRDDVDMIDVSVLTGPVEYVRHTHVGFGIMTAVAKLAAGDGGALGWLQPLLEGGVRTLSPGMLHTHDAGRLRLALRSSLIATHILISFSITPGRTPTGQPGNQS